MQENAILRNSLGVVQSLHNFFNSPKREKVLASVEMPDSYVSEPYIKLKSLSETRWTCRWDAVKAVEQQYQRILLALLELSKDKDPKTSVDAKGLTKAIVEFSFIFGLQILRVVFSNTSALSKYLQGHDVNAMTAKSTCEATISTLTNCRKEEISLLILEKAKQTAAKMAKIVPDVGELGFSKRQRKPSKRLQAVSGEAIDNSAPLTDQQIAKVTYYEALDRVVTEMRERLASRDSNILVSLANVVSGKAEDGGFNLVSEFYEIDKEILKSETNIFHNLQGIELNSTNAILNYLHSNSLFETMASLQSDCKNSSNNTSNILLSRKVIFMHKKTKILPKINNRPM